jgi:tRNA1Val (adenine37-N6)-methyltransferase
MSVFRFKNFSIVQEKSAMKVGTDAMVLGALLDVQNKKKCLDIGTGTGVLSLMVAQKNPAISIEAIELDVQSAEEAQDNFRNSPWSDRLRIYQEDFRFFSSDHSFDLIISNPPYFERGLLNDSKRKSNTRHEKSLPLNYLFKRAFQLLSSEGHFWLVLPYDTAEKWKKKAFDLGGYCLKEITIYGKPNVPKRTVFCFSFQDQPLQKSSLTLRNNDHSYTDEYRTLTKYFHGVAL